MALLLIKAASRRELGITVELLMLSSAAAIVGGIVHRSAIIGCGRRCCLQSRHLERFALVLELLAVVPFLCAIPALFHELAHSTLLHARGARRYRCRARRL